MTRVPPGLFATRVSIDFHGMRQEVIGPHESVRVPVDAPRITVEAELEPDSLAAVALDGLAEPPWHLYGGGGFGVRLCAPGKQIMVRAVDGVLYRVTLEEIRE